MSSLNQYSLGWICAIDTEIIAAELMFDEVLSAPNYIPASDKNSYKFGRISGHNVVVACLSQYGISNATAAVKDMMRTFPIEYVVVVGIAGGAPNLDNDIDIRLGDVVIGCPGTNNGGVLHYGFGKKFQDDKDPLRFETTGHLNQPPFVVLNAVAQLKASHRMRGHEIQQIMEEALRRRPELKSRLDRELRLPDNLSDRLYLSRIIHTGTRSNCDSCGTDSSVLVSRAERDPEDDPVIHYGLVASADILMRDAVMRDRLSREKGVLCFEMAAAGVMNHVPCIAIRGICDYSDSHADETWQGYAAMTAAAYTKELLANMRPRRVAAEEPPAENLMERIDNLNNQLHDVSTQLLSLQKNYEKNRRIHWI